MIKVRSVSKLPLEDVDKMGLIVSMPSFLPAEGGGTGRAYCASKTFTVYPQVPIDLLHKIVVLCSKLHGGRIESDPLLLSSE